MEPSDSSTAVWVRSASPGAVSSSRAPLASVHWMRQSGRVRDSSASTPPCSAAAAASTASLWRFCRLTSFMWMESSTVNTATLMRNTAMATRNMDLNSRCFKKAPLSPGRIPGARPMAARIFYIVL